MNSFIKDLLEDFRVRRQIRRESDFILKELKNEFRTLEKNYRIRNRLKRTYSPKEYITNFYETFLSILTKYASMKNYSYKIGRNPKEADYFEVLNYYSYRVNEEAIKHIKQVKTGTVNELDYWTLPEDQPLTSPESAPSYQPEPIGLLRLVEK